jgi:hypothetical protein
MFYNFLPFGEIYEVNVATILFQSSLQKYYTQQERAEINKKEKLYRELRKSFLYYKPSTYLLDSKLMDLILTFLNDEIDKLAKIMPIPKDALKRKGPRAPAAKAKILSKIRDLKSNEK